ncbi:MAG: hypothetical protein H0W89_07375 [Candidatus Levybacteria bacterium]|nr:hypothetical protein [Candidatus Levybacteria bacterium]
MNIFSDSLNQDQLNGIANLCFDLAKGALGIALVSTLNIDGAIILGVVRALIGFFM